MLEIAKMETKLSISENLRNPPIGKTCPSFKDRKIVIQTMQINKISQTQKFILNKSFYTVITEKDVHYLAVYLTNHLKINMAI